MVYAIRNSITRAVKIGYSSQPETRLGTLQTANVAELVLEGWCIGDKKFEERVHHFLRTERVRGEWFKGPKTESIVILLTLLRGSDDAEEERLRRRAIFKLANTPQERLNCFAAYIDAWDDESPKSQDQVAADIERILGWGHAH